MMNHEIPRRLAFALRLPGIPRGKWLDVGAGIGHYLQFMPRGSLGIDLKPDLSKNILYWNFESGFPSELNNSINVVWCSNLIEHVLNPHKFLIEMRNVFNLNEDCLLFIACPNSIILKKGPWKGTLAADHVNFFSLTTLKLTLEFAGYDIAFAGSPSFPKFPLWISKFLGPFGPTLLVAAKPIVNFQYGASAHKVLDFENQIKFKDESISDS